MFAQVNTPAVVSDIIEGEAVILNLVNGNYYSLEGVGAEVWDWLVQGNSIESVAQELSNRYPLTQEQIEPEVMALIEELEVENLITKVDVLKNKNQDFTLQDGATVEPGQAYQTPKLMKYTDLQDLLLLDPIHEVGPDGWPLAPRIPQ